MEAAKKVYLNGEMTPTLMTDSAVRTLSDETLRIFDDAIDGVLREDSSTIMRYALMHHARMFSGFKTYHSLMGAGLAIKAKDGDKRPMEDFLSDAEKVNRAYNHNYLYAERNQAAAAAQMADKWHDIEKDGDKYNLQYRTANDDKVREEHARLHGITLPPSDPFWDKYYPPNGWNCRCTAVQVRREKYPKSDPERAMQLGDGCTESEKLSIFRYNAGKSMELFPPKHPYYKTTDEVADAVNGNISVNASTEIDEVTKRIKDLGIEHSFEGLTDDNIEFANTVCECLLQFRSKFPKVMDKIQYVGTTNGQVTLRTKALIEKAKREGKRWTESGMRAQALAALDDSTACAYYDNDELNMGYRGIIVNPDYKGQNYLDALAEDVEMKEHPVGCNTLKYVIDHEIAHALDDAVNICSNEEYVSIYNEISAKGPEFIKKNLSNYANTDKHECYAEAIGEYLNNRKPRVIAAAMGEFTRQNYGKI
ncbi:MAG: minor capsid protein [Clostridia bacterium]|nr:minor capsid protein [Clostridia bacterium]